MWHLKEHFYCITFLANKLIAERQYLNENNFCVQIFYYYFIKKANQSVKPKSKHI